MKHHSTRPCCITMVVVVLTACAGKPPFKMSDNNAPCPIVSGIYCATGSISENSYIDPDRTYLPYYLGIESSPGWDTVDTVEIEGVNDGYLKLILRAGDDEFARAEVSRSELLCEADRFAIRMNTIPWGGAGPILALGASSGWRVIQRDSDGVLHIDQKRRETGTLMLVIPLILRSQRSMQFQPVGESGCPPTL